MKISYIVPANFNIQYKRQIGPTLGIAYMASLINQEIGIEDINIEIGLNSLLKRKPDLVGLPIYTEDYSRAIYMAKKIKQKLDIPIIAGGPHITSLPETLAKNIDIGVIGEGEFTMLDLVKLHQKNGLTHENLKNVPGIVYHHNGERIFTPKRILRPLDDLPLPDRATMKAFWPDKNETEHWEQGIYTSRGCPFKCIYCMYSKIRKNVRYHSIERIILDIEDVIINFPNQKNIIIFDDLFIISKKRLEKIVKAIKEAGFHKKVSFGCMARASIFDDGIAKLLKEMNVKVISFGLETGSEEVLKYLKIDAVSMSQNQRAIDNCSKYGINAAGYFILGAPVETKKDLSQTYWFIRKNLKDMPISGTFCMTPVPGTKVWDDALAKGIVSKDEESYKRMNYVDLIDDQYFFLNEKYDYNFFKKAYKDFQYIVDKPERMPYILEKQNYFENYKENLKKIVKPFLDNNYEKTLEIGEYLPLINEEYNFIDYREEMNLNEKFDLIFINHILCKTHKPYELLNKLINNLSKNGKILISIYNCQNIAFLHQLFLQDKNQYYKIREFDYLHYFSKISFTNNLRNNNISYNLLKEIPNIYNSSTDILYELVKAKIGRSSFEKEKDNFSYLFEIKKVD